MVGGASQPCMQRRPWLSVFSLNRQYKSAVDLHRIRLNRQSTCEAAANGTQPSPCSSGLPCIMQVLLHLATCNAWGD